MGFALRPGISFCDVSGRLLFLDVVADRYFCLRPESEAVFRQIMAGGVSSSEIPGGLSRSGMLIETEDAQTPQAFRLRCEAQASLLDGQSERIRTVELITALWHLRSSRRALRRGKLALLLGRLARAKARLASVSPAPSQALRPLATTFEQTARLTRSHDQCLTRSIALTRQCLAMGLPVDLVIGVRLRPFTAHSWVQAGPWLVNDHLDAVRTYAPILSV